MILDAWGWCTGTTQRDGMGREELRCYVGALQVRPGAEREEEWSRTAGVNVLRLEGHS